MSNRIARWIVVVGAVVCGASGPALASVTSGGFVPASAEDAQFIRNRGDGVWNTDPAHPRFVTASLDISSLSVPRTFRVFGLGNGVAQECVVTVTNVATGTTTRSARDSAVRGPMSYDIAVPAPGPGTFVYTLICRLPPLTGGAGSFIYGVAF
jgi:hypothetical protein